MPKFQSREEYEAWKREKIKTNLEESHLSESKERETCKEDLQAERPGTQLEEKQPAYQTKAELRPLGELFSNSWEIFSARFWTLFTLYISSVLSFLGVLAVFAGIGYGLSFILTENRNITITAGILAGVLPSSFAMFWCLAALAFAVADDQLGIRDALAKGWDRIFSFVWLISLVGFIVTGGFLLFFIPGIIFVVWFSFAQFILVSEGEKGMDALLKSKEYVKDKWFDVFLRLFVIWSASGVIGMIPILGPIVSFVFFPFVMIFTYLIYQDLRSLKGIGIVYPHSFGEKFKWIGTGILGYIVFPLFVIALFIGLFGVSLLTMLAILKGMPYR